MRKKEEILGARKEDIIKIINNEDLITQLDNGDLRCVKCGQQIGWENLGGFFYHKKTIKFVCDNLECVGDC